MSMNAVTAFHFTCGEVNRNRLANSKRANVMGRMNGDAWIDYVESAYFRSLKESPLFSTPERAPLKIAIIYYLVHGTCGQETRQVEGDFANNRITFHKANQFVILPLDLIGEMAQWCPFYSFEQLKSLRGEVLKMNGNGYMNQVPSITISSIIDGLLSANREGEKAMNKARSNIANFGNFSPNTGSEWLNESLKAEIVVSTIGYLYSMSKAFKQHYTQDRFQLMRIFYNFLSTKLIELTQNSSQPHSQSDAAQERYSKIIFVLSFLYAYPTTDTFWYSGAYKNFITMVRTSSSRVTYRRLYAFLMDYNQSCSTLGIPERDLRRVIGFKKLSDIYRRDHYDLPLFVPIADAYNARGPPKSAIRNFENELGNKVREAYQIPSNLQDNKITNQHFMKDMLELPVNYRQNMVSQVERSGKRSIPFDKNRVRQMKMKNQANAEPLIRLVQYFVEHSKVAQMPVVGALFSVAQRVTGRENQRKVNVFLNGNSTSTPNNRSSPTHMKFTKGKDEILFEIDDITQIARLTPYLSFHQLALISRLLSEYKEMIGSVPDEIRTNFIKTLVTFIVVLVPNSDLKKRLKENRINTIYLNYGKSHKPTLDSVFALDHIFTLNCEQYPDMRNAVLSIYQDLMKKVRVSMNKVNGFVCNGRRMMLMSVYSIYQTNDLPMTCEQVSEVIQQSANSAECRGLIHALRPSVSLSNLAGRNNNRSPVNATRNRSAVNGPLNGTVVNGPQNSTVVNGPLNGTVVNGPRNSTSVNGSQNSTVVNGPQNSTVVSYKKEQPNEPIKPMRPVQPVRRFPKVPSLNPRTYRTT